MPGNQNDDCEAASSAQTLPHAPLTSNAFRTAGELSEALNQTYFTISASLSQFADIYAKAFAQVLEVSVALRAHQMLTAQLVMQIVPTVEVQTKAVARAIAIATEMQQVLNSPHFAAYVKSLAETVEVAVIQTARAARIAEAVSQMYLPIAQVEGRSSPEGADSSAQTPVRRLHVTDHVQISVEESANVEIHIERRLIELEPLTVWQIRWVWLTVWCLPLILFDSSPQVQAWVQLHPYVVDGLLELWTGGMLLHYETFHQVLGELQESSED